MLVDQQAGAPDIVIRPIKGWQINDRKELLHYRDLFYFLVSRDIKVRYQQTGLGGLWAVIQPFISMVFVTVFLRRLVKVPSDGII